MIEASTIEQPTKQPIKRPRERPHKEKPDHFLNVVVCIIHMFHDGICVPYEYMHYGQHASTAYFGKYKKNP